MQELLANLVHPVLQRGLLVKERLDRGEQVDFSSEQAVLRGLLQTDVEARRWTEFGGDDSRTSAEQPRPAGARGQGRAPGADHFLGVRYALVCWLDELFVLDSPWSAQWNEQKLEVGLYGTNDRAWKFWDQARRAETRQGRDALEVFYLCVMLGFAGQLREQPDRLQSWTTATRAVLAQVSEREWPDAAEVDPPTQVPPLRGRELLQRMVLAGGLLLLLLIPVVAFFLVRKLGQ
jgi:type VI secretion system protein ImpK